MLLLTIPPVRYSQHSITSDERFCQPVASANAGSPSRLHCCTVEPAWLRSSLGCNFEKHTMKTRRSKILFEVVCAVLSVGAIYLAIWLTGFHDTARRWALLVSLFGIWLSFNCGRSVASRAVKTETGSAPVEQPRRSIFWGLACMVAIMLVVGVVLRITA